ncbi:transcriptional regulator [Cnuibacter physcomitrellae]|nr:helix-turn-helix transcriptional regulator [Cnuibacter physcomitrellae]GGI35291.1 transcriptional regulator [Cnuibacter physcomitrellae]
MPATRRSTPLGEFLRARREQVKPEQVGIDPQPGRRVPGLRREEVASLAGVSPDYYLRLEQGRDQRPSEQVLTALARALLLDEDSRQYLLKLARPRPFVRRLPAQGSVAPSVLQLLDQWSNTPAYVSDGQHDVLAVNPLMAGIAPGIAVPGTNMLVSAYAGYHAYLAGVADQRLLDAHQLSEWEGTLRELTASLRFHADPDDRRLHEIVGMLSARYPLFRTVWAEHLARPQLHGTKRAYVEPLGWIDFRFQTLEVPRSAGQFITALFGEPGSPAARAIAYIAARPAAPASWSQGAATAFTARSDLSRSNAVREASSDGTNTIRALSS